MLISLVTRQDSNYMDSFHASANIKKITNFLMLFCLLFAKVISPKAKEICEKCKFFVVFEGGFSWEGEEFDPPTPPP